jgi:hypothetical protein
MGYPEPFGSTQGKLSRRIPHFIVDTPSPRLWLDLAKRSNHFIIFCLLCCHFEAALAS